MEETEIKNQIAQLDKEIDNMIFKKYELQEKHFKLYELQNIKEKYLNKYFIYRNNCYSCQKKKSDYWNVYYKVIEVNDDGGIIAVSLEKDKYENISSEIKTIGTDYIDLEEITEKEYIKETSKILGVLQERYSEK